MFVIGLTGGIGSGKTVASDHFGTLGIDVVDTDVIARQIVEAGSPVLDKLAITFGQDILLENGGLDRGKLREIAFSSEQNKSLLDAITHPAIREETLIQIGQASSTYCIVVVPLLTSDSVFREVMHRILVVTAEQEIKVTRVMKRSNLSRETTLSIMGTQLSDEERLKFADDVIENNSTLEHVYAEVEKLDKLYQSLADSPQD